MKKIILGFFIVVVLIIGLIGIIGYIKLYVPGKKVQLAGQEVMVKAKDLKSVFSQNDIDLLSKKLEEFDLSYQRFEKASEQLYWAQFIPQIKDFKSAVEAGRYLLRASREAVTAISPYADLIGFKKGTTSFVERAAEDRLQTAVLTLDKVLTKLDSISSDIGKAGEKIASIDPKRYPQKVGNMEVRNLIINAQQQFIGIEQLFVDAKPLLKNIPNILGKDKEKVYLILFQNDKERRATGGFLTAYALFKINNGKIRIEKSDDIYSLDASIASHPVAPPEILTYHKDVTKFNIRDSNLSPDFVNSVQLFNSLYEKSSLKVKYDGVIAIDSKVLVDMLSIFGDTEADGVVFSSKIDKRCDCPEVLYKLFDMVDRPVNYIKEDRKGILGDLMYALFYKALGFSPSKYWGKLAETMLQNLYEKHIIMYFTDPTLQEAVERMNFGGRIRSAEGDYLHVNTVNFAGAKSNLFVSESITSTAKSSNGAVEREVQVDFKNPYPHSDCNLERGGLCLNATLRNWVRIYVPEGAKLIEFKGSQMKVNTYDELGKTVFEGFMTVIPEGKASIVIRYTIPASVVKNGYSLSVQKQPGVLSQELKVYSEGKKIFDGNLVKDIVIK